MKWQTAHIITVKARAISVVCVDYFRILLVNCKYICFQEVMLFKVKYTLSRILIKAKNKHSLKWRSEHEAHIPIKRFCETKI